MHCIRFTAPGDRPDYRQVPVYLWGEGHAFDCSSNSYHPAKQEWSWFCLSNREKPSERLEILTEATSPMILTRNVVVVSHVIMQVQSQNLPLAARAAFYLATYSGGEVALKLEDPFSPPDILLPHLGPDFNPTAALTRAQASPFTRSFLGNPQTNS